MYCVVLFAVGILTVVAHPRGEGMPKCGRIAHGGLECCIKEIPRMLPSEDVKECFQLEKKPLSCDVEICIAKKHGVASDDGTIDKKKMTDEIEKKFESEPDLADSIKDNCINGDLSKYGTADICDLMKLKLCIEVQIIKSCDEWKEDGACSGMQTLAADCIKKFE